MKHIEELEELELLRKVAEAAELYLPDPICLRKQSELMEALDKWKAFKK